MAVVATGAHCAAHPDVPAVEICTRCGSFVCSNCLELQGSDVLCQSCFTRAGGGGKASGRAVAALVLGLIGINCGFIWGIIGLVLAYQELGAIDRGESPAAGRSLATGGKILGWINVGIIGLGVIAGIVIGIVALAKS